MASVQCYEAWPMATKTYLSGIGQVRKSRVEVWSSDRRVFLLGLKLLGFKLLGLKAIVLRLLALCIFMGLTASSFMVATAAAQTTSAQESAPATPEPQVHVLAVKPVEIARSFNFPHPNSMLANWMVAVGLIAFAQ